MGRRLCVRYHYGPNSECVIIFPDKVVLMTGQKDEMGNEVSQSTLKPTRYIPPAFPITPAKAGSSSRAGNSSLVDDYSDMAFDEDEPELEAKMASLKVCHVPMTLALTVLSSCPAQESITERYSASERYQQDENSCCAHKTESI